MFNDTNFSIQSFKRLMSEKMCEMNDVFICKTGNDW
jgi:hypothetical protein